MSSSWKRKYSELKGQGLIVLSEELFTVIKHLEESYQKRTETYLHLEMYELTFYKEWRITWGKVSAVLSLCWALEACPQLQSLVLGLFVSVHFHSTLKENSSLFSAPSAKCNHKMLKLICELE